MSSRSDRDPAQKVGRAAAWIALLALIAYIVLIGGTYTWMGSTTVRVVTHLVVATFLAGWLVLAVRRPAWRPGLGPTVLVAAPILAAGLSTIASPSPRLSAEGLATGVLWALTFLMATRLGAHPWFRPRVIRLLALIAIGTALAYLIQVGLAWLEWWQLTGIAAPPLRPAGVALTFGASPVVAGLTLMLGPFAIVELGRLRRGRALVAAAGIAGSVAILITGSRAAYLGLGASIIAAIGILVADPNRTRTLRSVLKSQPKVLVAAGLAVALLAAGVLTRQLAGRILDGGTIGERLDIWLSAIQLFGQSPVLGTGPGTWPVLKYAANPPGEPNLVVPHAHNVVLQTASDLGLLGLVACGLVFGALVLAAARGRRSRDSGIRATSGAALISLAGIAALSLFDDFANLGTIVLPLLLVAGVVVGQSGEAVSVSGRAPSNRFSTIGAAAALALVLPFLLSWDVAALRAAAGTRAAGSGDAATSAEQFEEAFRSDPDHPLYRMESAIALAREGRHSEAVDRLSPAARLEASPLNLLSLAWYQYRAGDVGGAVDSARTAYERGTGDPIVALNVGAIAELGSDDALASRAFATAVLLAPSLAGSTYFQENPRRRAAIDEAVELGRQRLDPSQLPLTTALIRGYAGDAAAAEEALAGAALSPERERVAAALAWRFGNREAAIRGLRAQLEREPMSGPTARQLADYLAAIGDPAAQRYERWAALLGTGSVARTAATGSDVQPAEAANSSGQPANYPWMLYAQYAPALISSPDLLVVR